MPTENEQTEELMNWAARGDDGARQSLLQRYRDRLRRMVAVRLDARLQARLDPSDVVQEALLEAARRLPDYLRERPVAFYPWLRRLAWEHLVKLHQKHLLTRKRSAARELPLPDDSLLALARQLAPGTSPSQRLVRQEVCERVRQGLDQLPEVDQEVLVLRYLEQLDTAETAAVLGVSEGAVKMRHRRALERLGGLLNEPTQEDRP
jgi:RNA polymerase sigma-70 factor (ECF subfamily)